MKKIIITCIGVFIAVLSANFITLYYANSILNEKIKNTESKIDILTNNLKSFENSFNSINDRLDIKKSYPNIETSLSKLDNAITGVSNIDDNISKFIKTLENKTDTKLENITNNLNNLDKNLNSLNDKLDIKKSYPNISTSLSNLENAIAGINNVDEKFSKFIQTLEYEPGKIPTTPMDLFNSIPWGIKRQRIDNTILSVVINIVSIILPKSTNVLFEKNKIFDVQKSCFVNQETIKNALTKYRLYNGEMKELDLSRLIQEHYLESLPEKPDSNCEYKVLKGDIYCEHHGNIACPLTGKEDFNEKKRLFAISKQKACFSNLRVIQGAVEMYNMDHSTMMTSLNLDKLIDGNYIKSIDKPCSECSYYNKGDLSNDGVVACSLHGDIEHPAPLK